MIVCIGCACWAVAGVAAAETGSGVPAPLTVQTVAGSGTSGPFPTGGGTALEVPIDQPFGVEVGPDSALYITSVGQHRVLRLDPRTKRITSVAGSGAKGYAGDGGPATQAQLNEPYEIRFDRGGNMFFVEMQNHVVRRVDARSHKITTVAGTGAAGFAGDGGPAASAQFRQPHSIALDDRGALYVADIGNHRIRKIDLDSRIVTTVAGNGEMQLPLDGRVTQGHSMVGPRALSITGRTMWIALREGHSVWRMDLDTLVARHVAGSGAKGYGGDGGPAPAATFNGPKGIAATEDGVLYVVDTENQAIRAIDTRAGRVHTVAGSGPTRRGFAVDHGPALDAQFDRPHGICLAPDGSLYIGDTNNHRVRLLKK
jgi:DNA-binding beta-propeller fold protein YncE